MSNNLSGLSDVIDIINDSYFYDKKIPLERKKTLANQIVNRQSKGYPYGNLYGITEKEKSEGIRLFTGEKLIYSAKARHVSGEEALRALKILNIKEKNITESLYSASQWMEERLLKTENTGFYCCKGCTPSVWRALGANVFPMIDKESWVVNGVKWLKQYRDGKGKWKSLPYYYTILSLMEFDFKEVNDELHYTIPVLEKVIKTIPRSVYQKRRVDIAERILNKYS